MTSNAVLCPPLPLSNLYQQHQSPINNQHLSHITHILHLEATKLLSMPSRAASHSGSWYSDDPRGLTRQLDQWLSQVPESIEGLGSLPVPGARIVIAPYDSLHCIYFHILTQALVMPDTGILEPARPTLTGHWICLKRELSILLRVYSI